MPIQDYGRYMDSMARTVEGPVNAFYQAHDRQRAFGQQEARTQAYSQAEANQLAYQQQEDDELDERESQWAELVKAGRLDEANMFAPDLTQEYVQTKAAIEKMQNPQAEQLSLQTQPGPFGSQIVTDGKSRFQVVQPPTVPRSAGPAALEPPKAPSGYRPTAAGDLEPIPGGPADPTATQQLSPKDTNTARVKLNQVKIARAALQRVKNNWQKIQGGMTAGPLQGYVPSEGGKAFDAAVNAMRGSITALTRVPGVGAMSDYETRLDQSKFPERTSYETVTADQMQGLEDLLNNVESGYQEMLGSKPETAAPKGAPKMGDNVRGYIFIGGDPADKKRWVKAK